MKSLRIAALMLIPLSFMSCSHYEPLPTVESVDIDRFMGLWYVQGYTPIIVDKNAHNAIEHYRKAEGNKIATTYQFRKDAPDGKLKTYTPTGTIYDETTNAEWRMQFIWPFKAKYLIHHLSNDYNLTIIAHPNRKYAWIMNRTPEMDDELYQQMVEKLAFEGFDPDKIFRVPHDWTNEKARIESYPFF
jgi:apolipoprotein D and lipocalin family protein